MTTLLYLVRCPFCLRELPHNRTTAVSEQHRAASLNNGRGLRGHDISAEIEIAHRDADHYDHERSSKAHRHDLKMGGAVCGVERPVHECLHDLSAGSLKCLTRFPNFR